MHKPLEVPLMSIPEIGHLPESHLTQEVVEIDDAFVAGEQRFSTSFTPGDGSRSNELLVVSTAFLDGPHTAMQSLRNRLYAHVTGLDVVSVGVPGMAASELDMSMAEADQYTLSSEQRKALNEGDFTALGRALWTAIGQNLVKNNISEDQLRSRKIHMLNYSLGVSTAAGMLIAAEAYASNPGRIVNLEGAAYESTSRRERIAAFTSKAEQEANAQYEARNPQWVPKTTDFRSLLRLMGNIANYPLVHYSVGTGLARGRITEQLLNGLRALDIPTADIDVILGNGDAGRVSTTNANDEAADTLTKATGSKEIKRVVFSGDHHGLCNDLSRFIPRVEALMR